MSISRIMASQAMEGLQAWEEECLNIVWRTNMKEDEEEETMAS